MLFFNFKKPSQSEFIWQSLKHPSVILLVLVNLMPLIGVIFFRWDIFSIMLLYWLESGVVGFLNVLKMIKINNSMNSPLIPMFIVHYTIFMFFHLALILIIFKPNLEITTSGYYSFLLVWEYINGILLSLFFLLLSHGGSFLYNFLWKKEYKKMSLRQQMFAPYQRILVMQLTLFLLGSFMVWTNFDLNIAAISLLVLIKIVFDILSHVIEHYKLIFKNHQFT